MLIGDEILGGNMEVFTAIQSNLAVRRFRDIDVIPKHISRILEAGRLCQSGKNLQPWVFIWIRSKNILNALADLMIGDLDEDIMRNAPSAIALVSDPSSEFHLTDVARAAQNMTLAAWELGVGSCWISGPEGDQREPYRKKAQALLGIPPSLNFLDLLVIGYPDKPCWAHSKERKRLNQICFEDRFGNPLSL